MGYLIFIQPSLVVFTQKIHCDDSHGQLTDNKMHAMFQENVNDDFHAAFYLYKKQSCKLKAVFAALQSLLFPFGYTWKSSHTSLHL